MTIDLHMHSSASDGDLTPDEVVTLCAREKVDLMALTDHDTVAGLSEAREKAHALGLRFINGIEVSSAWGRLGIHIVGLGFDPEHPAMVALCDRQVRRRHERSERMRTLFAEAGLLPVFEHALTLATNPLIFSRAHVAKALVALEVVDSMDAAFNRYVGDGKPLFVEQAWPTLDESVNVIHEAGGLAVLAHPGRYRYHSPLMRDLLMEHFAEIGGDAIEVTSGSQSTRDTAYFAGVAKRFDWWASTGSDFHREEGARPLPGAQPPLPDGLKPIWTVL